MNFSNLSEQFQEDWQRTIAGSCLYRLSFTDETPDGVLLKDKISGFFKRHGFVNLDYLRSGSSAVVLKDLDNPDLVFRIAPTYEFDKRACIPQVLQPLYVPLFDDGRVKLEFLPNVSMPEDFDDETFFRLLKEFKKEVLASGHTIESDTPQCDVGLLTYEIGSKPGTYGQAFVATDASLIPPIPGLVPRHSEGYPSLEDQWRVQCKMVERDPRLKALLNGYPPKPGFTEKIIGAMSPRQQNLPKCDF